MAEWSGFFDAHKIGESWDRTYLAEDFAKFFAPLIGNGVFAGRSNELQVFQAVPAGMSVVLSSGQSWIEGYGYTNDSDLIIPIDPADGALGRIDRIVNQWSAVDRQIRTIWKKGTPAVNPVAPPLRWDADYKELNLCTLDISAGLSAVTQDKIKDTRADSSVCGWVTGLIDQVDTDTLFAQWEAAYENEFAKQKAAWEKFFGDIQSDLGLPIPSPDKAGNVISVNTTGEYILSDKYLKKDDVGDLVDMDNHRLVNVAGPVERGDAANKEYVDLMLPKSGGEMNGALGMGGNKITGLGAPTDAADAATKGYADTKASLPKTASGTVIALSDASSGPLQGLRIFGRTTQDGTPTPEAPVELVSVGSGGSIAVSIGTSQEDTSPQTLPISTPNGLPGIPVTSGGNYTDANGQQWICDEVDFARGVYVKRVTKVMFDGSGNIALNGNKQYPSTNVRFDLVCKDVPNIANQSGAPQTILSNYSVAARAFNSTGVWLNNEHDYFEGRISMPSSIASTVEEFSELLANTPIVFIVPLATPIETPIPEDELAAYDALHTNRPNTTVYNDAGAHMDVGYYPPNATMRQEDILAYVDGKRFTVSATITTSWTGSAAPYTQSVTVSGILATDFPHVTPVYSSTLATALAQKEAWSMVNQGVPGAGEITFTCFDDKPATEIPIQIEVMR